MIPLDLSTVAAVTGGVLHGTGGPVGAVVIDSREVVPGTLFAALPGEHVDGHDFAPQALGAGATAVLGTRTVDGPSVVVDDVTVALGRLAHANRLALSAPVVGVTGSQGKTSVKDLLAHVLGGVGPTVAPTGSFNNELGVPLTVLRADADTRFLVVEMGARGIGHIRTLCDIAVPDVGVVLNVGTAHVGEFGSPDNIAVAKGELVEALSADGTAVLNADDARVAAMTTRTAARVLTFGTAADADVRVTLDRLVDGSPEVTLRHGGSAVTTTVPQIGAHHAINAAAAAAAALAVGVELATVGRRLATAVAASPMRMERHVRADGLVVVNDAYNANPESTAAALHAVAEVGRSSGRPVVAVLGEMLELGDGSTVAHESVGRLAAELGVSSVVAVGPGAEGVARGAGAAGVAVTDVDAALTLLDASLRPDAIVLVKASRGARLERVAHALLTR